MLFRFYFGTSHVQITGTTKFVIINNKDSVRSDAFVEADLLDFH